MKVTPVRIFAALNVLLVGYLLFELYQFKNPKPSEPVTFEPVLGKSAANSDELVNRALDISLSGGERLRALGAIRAEDLTPEQQIQLLSAFFVGDSVLDPLTLSDLRGYAGQLLIAGEFDPLKLSDQFASTALEPDTSLPLRNQALVQLYRLVNHQAAAKDPSPEPLAKLRDTADTLFEDRSSSLAATVIDGDAFLMDRHPELISSDDLRQRVLRGLRDLRSSETVKLTALGAARKAIIAEALADAQEITRDPIQPKALQLAAIETALALGAPEAFFQSLQFGDAQLEIARLNAIQRAASSRNED